MCSTGKGDDDWRLQSEINPLQLRCRPPIQKCRGQSVLRENLKKEGERFNRVHSFHAWLESTYGRPVSLRPRTVRCRSKSFLDEMSFQAGKQAIVREGQTPKIGWLLRAGKHGARAMVHFGQLLPCRLKSSGIGWTAPSYILTVFSSSTAVQVCGYKETVGASRQRIEARLCLSSPLVLQGKGEKVMQKLLLQ